MTPAGGQQRASRGVFAIEEAELLLPNPIALPLGDVTTTATTFMTTYGIASYDAAHAASAIAAGADAIVTLDTAFALLPSSLLTVYTDRSRLASCRNKRPRRAKDG